MRMDGKRRKSARISHKASVEYTPYGLLVPRLEPTSLHGTSVDISEDDQGLSFLTSHPLFTGRRLRLVTSGIARTAVVRWVRAAPEGYRAGVSLRAEAPAMA
jgi:hypothetical protein